jgi:hypothetical protein
VIFLILFCYHKNAILLNIVDPEKAGCGFFREERLPSGAA